MGRASLAAATAASAAAVAVVEVAAAAVAAAASVIMAWIQPPFPEISSPSNFEFFVDLCPVL